MDRRDRSRFAPRSSARRISPVSRPDLRRNPPMARRVGQARFSPPDRSPRGRGFSSSVQPVRAGIRRVSAPGSLPAPSRPLLERVGRLIPASAILMIAFVLSRVLGLLKFVVLNGTLSGRDLNAFWTAFRVPDTVFLLFSGGALTSALIPTLSGLLAKDEDQRAWQTATTVFTVTLLSIGGVTIMAFILTPAFVPILMGHNTADIGLTTTLVRIMLAQPLFLALGSILMALYNAHHRFTVPALAPLLYNVGIIVGAIVGGLLIPRWGVAAVAWGVTLGALGQLLVQAVGLRRLRAHQYARRVAAGFPGRRRRLLWLKLGDPAAHEIGRLMGPRLFGQAGLQASLLVTTALANNLPTYVNQDLQSAWTLVTLPVGIFAAALGVAAFPRFSNLWARGEAAAFGEAVSGTLRRVLFLIIPATVGLIVLRGPLIDLLFHHGRFSAVDTAMTAAAFLFYAVGIPGHAAVEVLPRAFFALKETRLPVVVNLWTLGLTIVLSFLSMLLLPAADGYLGLALALSIGVVAEAVWLAVLLHRQIGGLQLSAFFASLARVLVATAALLIVMLIVQQWRPAGLPGGRITADLLQVIAGVASGGGIYLGMAALLHAEELAVVRTMIRR